MTQRGVAPCLLFFLIFLSTTDAVVRRYYLAANEIVWNYAPSNYNYFDPEEGLFTPGTFSGLYFVPGPDRIGGTYLKAKYQAYTDDTFTEMIADDPHLGILGPTLYAEEGDTLEVIFTHFSLIFCSSNHSIACLQVFFRNNARFNFSIHPHAVFYTPENAGTGNGPFLGLDHPGASVPPNGTTKYTWFVPARAGTVFLLPFHRLPPPFILLTPSSIFSPYWWRALLLHLLGVP